MKNIHILPTDKPSRLFLNKKNNTLFINEQFDESSPKIIALNIYITSDEEITGFENNIWVIKGDRIFLWQNTMALVSNNKPKKIILTTDQDLIKDGVQAIPEYFLKWFIEKANDSGKAIDIIETKSHLDSNYFDNGKINYQIIIPKEEYEYIGECKGNNGNGCFMDSSGHDCGCFIKIPKEETEHLLSTKANKEILLEDVFNDEKRQGVKELIDKHKQGRDKIENDFLKCLRNSKVVYQPKQETLEEAAEKWFNKDGFYPDPKQGFISGAKWQQERSYSDEEVLELWNWLNDGFIIRKSLPTREELIGWFEQFKKK